MIDYVCVELNMIGMIRKLNIEELGFSDHMLLIVEIGEWYLEI